MEATQMKEHNSLSPTREGAWIVNISKTFGDIRRK